MLQTVLVMLGSGLAGMLLFVVGAKGSLAALFVTYLTPLPIMIAALGWGHLVGLGAACLGAFLIGVLVHPIFALFYIAAFALPAWWLAYLALLARFAPGASSRPDPTGAVQREWYPLGRIAFWTPLIGCCVAIAGVLSVSGDRAGFEIAARSTANEIAPVVETMFGGSVGLPAGVSAQDLAILFVRAIPVGIAASLTMILLINLWLASRAVEVSHRLPRPWPNVPDNFRLPRLLLVVFPAAVAAAVLLDGYAGLFSTIVAAAFVVPLVMQGLAVVHVLTRARAGRRAILAAVYASLLTLMPWSAIVLTIVGLLDLAVSLRDRFATVRPASPP